MPVADWQFVVVTLIAAGGLWTLVRKFVPARQPRGARDAHGNLVLPQKPTACAHCASNPAADTPQHQTRRTETVPVVALRDLRETARSVRHLKTSPADVIRAERDSR
jgi:hypothetical protein